jgi:hypothetical protein
MLQKSALSMRVQMLAYQSRNFSVVPKLNRVELTIRTPYKTILNNCNGFQRLYANTIKGQIAIGNKSIPRVYLLPPGEVKVHGIIAGAEGNFSTSDSGAFMHTGGWLHVHE